MLPLFDVSAAGAAALLDRGRGEMCAQRAGRAGSGQPTLGGKSTIRQHLAEREEKMMTREILASVGADRPGAGGVNSCWMPLVLKVWHPQESTASLSWSDCQVGAGRQSEQLLLSLAVQLDSSVQASRKAELVNPWHGCKSSSGQP